MKIATGRALVLKKNASQLRRVRDFRTLLAVGPCRITGISLAFFQPCLAERAGPSALTDSPPR